jgi:hypothetical protein
MSLLGFVAVGPGPKPAVPEAGHQGAQVTDKTLPRPPRTISLGIQSHTWRSRTLRNKTNQCKVFIRCTKFQRPSWPLQ